MFVSVDMAQMQSMQNDMNIMYEFCKTHICQECDIYYGKPMQIGNSIFQCQNFGKGENNASEVSE